MQFTINVFLWLILYGSFLYQTLQFSVLVCMVCFNMATLYFDLFESALI